MHDTVQKSPLTSKVFLTGIWSAIISAIGMGLLGLFWLLWPYGGLNATLHVDTPQVQQGTLMSYTIKYCVDDAVPLPIIITREFELQSTQDNMLTFAIAPPLSYVIQNRCESFTRVVGVPIYMPLGTYHIHSHSSLKVNPLRSIDQTFSSDTFRIIPSISLKGENGSIGGIGPAGPAGPMGKSDPPCMPGATVSDCAS